MLILSITIIGMIGTWIWWVVDAFLLHTWVKDHNRALEYQIVNGMLSQQQPPVPGTF